MSPARPPLDRPQILRAALALIDADGLEGFSMRRLGTALGVDPMAVYYHVPSKAALFDGLVDDLWARLDLAEPAAGTPWRESIAVAMRALRRELLTHPRIIPLVASRPAVTPGLLGVLDRALGWLAAAGLPPASTAMLLDCLVAYTVGMAQGEARDPVGGTAVDPEEVYRSLTPDSYPHLTAAMATGYDWQPEEAFETGLAALLAGWPG